MQVSQVSYLAADVDAQIVQSLRETGFAVLADHPITPARITEIYEGWGAFFAGSEKQEFLRDPERQDGYFPFRSENAKGAQAKDLKEFFHIYPWGRVPDNLADITRQLYADLEALGVEMLGWLDAHSPDEVRRQFRQPLSQMMQDSQQSLLRIIHYPPVADGAEPEAIRAAAHEDINLITLLLTGSQPGLQARDKQGSWHDVSCDPGMITINNGDMLQVASGGYYPSTPHRVINPDPEQNVSRYSIPMFLHPRPEVMLTENLSADTYLTERLAEIGLKQ